MNTTTPTCTARGERSALSGAILLALVTMSCGSSGDSAPGRAGQAYVPSTGGSPSGDELSGSGGTTAPPATGNAGAPAPPFVAMPKDTGGGGTSSGGRAAQGGSAKTGGRDGSVSAVNGGAPANGGSSASAGSGAIGTAGAPSGNGATTGSAGSSGTAPLNGDCCSDGDCLCREPPPSSLTSSAGPYKTATQTLTTGTLHYPTDAEPPFAGLAIVPGFLNSGPEMAPWGRFYASWGIAVVVANTGPLDLPDLRGSKLVAAIEELKAQNSGSGPLAGKLAGRYGTSGYSMGGGGTTLASAKDPTFKTSVGLAAWAPEGRNVKVPTLFLCGTSDTVASCSLSQTAYDAMGSTPKMLIKISGANHFNWFGPADAGRGTSGSYALAFQKVFLEGDERWRPLLLEAPAQGSVATNIQ